MFQPWRYQLREAQAALTQGRLEEAERLAGAAELTKFLPGKELIANLASEFAARATQRGATGDFVLAWRDLKKAKELGGESATWGTARDQLVNYELEVLQNHLRASDHSGALMRLDELGRRDLAGVNVATLKEMVQRLASARRLVQHGKFPAAQEHFAAVAALRGDLPVTAELAQRAEQQAGEARTLHAALHRALAASDWSEALQLADRLLSLTPLCPIANEARRRAWAEVGAKAPATNSPVNQVAPPADATAAPTRGMLWIDGVGGYLVCLASEVVIGQAFPGAKAAIPLQADLAREHLRIRREGEGYLLEPLTQPVRSGGRTITEISLLADGDEVELGNGVRIRFHRPHALSASARIDFLSRHRPRPFADGVILMAESCVLGPKKNSHILCREWTSDVVLYRHEQQLACRAMEPFVIDSVRHDGRGKLAWTSLVTGSEFSFKLEPLA